MILIGNAMNCAMSVQSDLSFKTVISDIFLKQEMLLLDELTKISFGASVEYIYNPLSYAIDVHKAYLDKYCNGSKKLLFLGMNPGPWGMMQNGVPFGETNSVRDFLDLFGTVHKPDREHPSKPVLGFSCTRSEISGRRFWELARVLGAGSPHQFFKHAFVHNYFPLCLLSSNGKNITPPELKANVQKEIELACDDCLLEVLLLLKIEVVVAVGRFVEKRVQKLCSRANLPIQVVFISHPSPRNPSSNRDWLSKTKNLIIDSDLAKYFAV